MWAVACAAYAIDAAVWSSPRALEANHGYKMAKPSGLLREIDQKCLKRRRMRCRRVHVYSTDPRRPQGDLFGRD